jgi:hypothetical protein
MATISIGYSRSDFATTTRHASTSLPVRVSDAQRIVLIASKTTARNGNRIVVASSFLTAAGSFL